VVAPGLRQDRWVFGRELPASFTLQRVSYDGCSTRRVAVADSPADARPRFTAHIRVPLCSSGALAHQACADVTLASYIGL